MFRDLFMEQVFLCAYIGFNEFVENQIWMAKIGSWQNKKGCYKYFDDEITVGKDSFEEICSSHMTGLGAAVLGLFSRVEFLNNVKDLNLN